MRLNKTENGCTVVISALKPQSEADFILWYKIEDDCLRICLAKYAIGQKTESKYTAALRFASLHA